MPNPLGHSDACDGHFSTEAQCSNVKITPHTVVKGSTKIVVIRRMPITYAYHICLSHMPTPLLKVFLLLLLTQPICKTIPVLYHTEDKKRHLKLF